MMFKTIPLHAPPYDSRIVCNSFLRIANSQTLESLDPQKANKLVYLAHGFYLGNYGQPLIEDHIEAWPYGPVVPKLYTELLKYMPGRIDYWNPRRFSGYAVSLEPPVVDLETQTFLEEVWKVYGPYDGNQLAEFASGSGTPWDKIYNQLTTSSFEGRSGALIPNTIIQEYYRRLINAPRGGFNG